MTGEDAALAVIDALEDVGMAYFLSGSFASNHYGVPRATQDADFVIELAGKSVSQVTARLGPAFHLDPQLAFETATMTTKQVIRLSDPLFTIELFHLSDDPHDQERFRRRCRVPLLGRQVWLPTAEDVIVTKLRWTQRLGRTKDRDDARDVIAVQGDRIDWTYVHGWCEQHGTRALLDEIRRSIPPI